MGGEGRSSVHLVVPLLLLSLCGCVGRSPEVAAADWAQRLQTANELTRKQDYRRARPLAAEYAQGRTEDWRGPFLLGMISSGEGKMAESLSHYEEAIRRAPEHAPAYLNAGATLLFGPASPARLAEASRWFERGLAIAPRYPELHYYLGLVRFRQRRWKEASVSLREAVNLRPNLAEAYYPLAQALRRLGRTTEAKLCLDLYRRFRAAEATQQRAGKTE